MIPNISLASLTSQTENFQEALLREAEAESKKALNSAMSQQKANANAEEKAKLTTDDLQKAMQESEQAFDVAEQIMAMTIGDQFGFDLNLIGKGNAASFGGK